TARGRYAHKQAAPVGAWPLLQTVRPPPGRAALGCPCVCVSPPLRLLPAREWHATRHDRGRGLSPGGETQALRWRDATAHRDKGVAAMHHFAFVYFTGCPTSLLRNPKAALINPYQRQRK